TSLGCDGGLASVWTFLQVNNPSQPHWAIGSRHGYRDQPRMRWRFGVGLDVFAGKQSIATALGYRFAPR
ncbi:hypothetical protein L1K69_23620, partial [Salmonella enterica subsp. enterica serovar Anatum]|nr:hypothetical protein [Salmonella enterica subsp. enterica serovar Anatum]